MATLALGTLQRVATSLAKLGELITQHGWLLTLVIASPLTVVCVTVITLVLTVQPNRRVEAISALSPVLVALVAHRRLLSWTSSHTAVAQPTTPTPTTPCTTVRGSADG